MDTLLTIPDNIEVTETPTSIYWFDEDGILCSVNKKAPEPTMEEIRQQLEDFNKMAQGRKFCMLGDVTNSTPSSKETREFAATEIPKLVIAMAMVSASPMGRMLANLFFALKPAPYPAKMFATVAEAKAWLRQYLDK
ncbi:MAG: STAS/SEC14 domain-containing protein [Sphingobacteriales bacterium JAD_PAG50586_3]|nr:MAG: STAS/SEC14 domain-containing protein [Sphingobacteriales bacterium JAD_PAG50586_3]